MGFSMSWVAVETAGENALFAQLGLEATGETSADGPEFDLCGARLPGWYLLVADHSDALVDEHLLKALSAHGRVIAAMVEEHVMFSSAEEWRKGERVWGAIHLPDAGLYHIGVEGVLPEAYAAIHQRQFAEQEKDGGPDAGVDHIIDIPLELAAAITGFRHDRAGPAFHELEAERPLNDAKQRPIDGASCNKGLDRKTSKWYQEHHANRPGLFGRLFGKR